MAATVLIVDDETLLLRTLSNALRDVGYEVLSASSAEGGEALLESRTGSVDLMLLDVKLPGRSGLDLLEQQRRQGYVGSAIVMTAFDSPDSEGRCRQLSVDRYLRKPFDLEAMLGLIHDLLEGRGIQSGSTLNGTNGLTPEGG